MLSIGATTKVFLRPGATDLRLGYEDPEFCLSLSRSLSLCCAAE